MSADDWSRMRQEDLAELDDRQSGLLSELENDLERMSEVLRKCAYQCYLAEIGAPDLDGLRDAIDEAEELIGDIRT